MVFELARRWWVIALRGLVAILFGILTLAWPALTLFVLIALFGTWAIVDGVLDLMASYRAGKAGERWGALLFEGLLSVAAGVLAFVWPHISAFALLFVIAFWAIVKGVAEISAAIRLRKLVKGELWLALAGALSIAFGLLLLRNPAVGALAVLYLLGAYAIMFGVLIVALGFRLRRVAHWPEQHLPSGMRPAL